MARFIPIIIEVKGDKEAERAGAQVGASFKKSAVEVEASGHKITNTFRSVGQSAQKMGQTKIGNPLADLKAEWDAKAKSFTSDLDLLRNKMGTASTGAHSFALSLNSVLLAVDIASRVIPQVLGAVQSLGQFLFSMATNAAKAALEITSLSTKTGFAVTTISGLTNAAGYADVSVGSLSTSLGIFDKNIEAVREGNKNLGKAFQTLNIDVSNNEAALRSAFKSLMALPAGHEQVTASQRLFGEGGKEILAIVRETNGDIDEAIQRYHDLGSLMGGKSVKDAAEFQRQLVTLEQQFENLKNTIATEFMPVLTGMMTIISEWLSNNREEWQSWGRGIGVVLLSIVNMPEFQSLFKLLSFLGGSGAKVAVNNAASYQYDATAAGTDPESKRNAAIAATLKKDKFDLGLGPGERAARAAKPEFTSDQIRFARQIVQTGFSLGANERQVLAALAAAYVESKVQNLRGGDRDSRGIFQQRPSQGWGTVAQILSPEHAIEAFFRGAGPNAGIFDVSQTGTVGQLAQRVQRSAFPKRYDQAMGPANRLFNLAVADGIKLKEPEPLNPFKGLSPRQMFELVQRNQEKKPLAQGNLEIGAQLPTKIQREWDNYYEGIGKREREIAERRADFAVEYEVTQRDLKVTLEHLDLDLAHLRKQNADDQFVEQRRLLMARGEEVDLLRQLGQVQDEIATGPYNESLRIQLALTQDILNIRRRDEQAIIAQNRAQLELADATVVHSEQVRAAVLGHLASQRTMTEAWGDGIISIYDQVTSVVDKGIQKLTGGLGLVSNLLSSIARQLLNRLFQRFLDAFFPSSSGGGGGLGQGQTAGAGAGGGGGGGWGAAIGNIVSGAFRGGGGGVSTGGYGGGSGASGILGKAGAFISRLFGGGGASAGGGIAVPPALSGIAAAGLGAGLIGGGGAGAALSGFGGGLSAGFGGAASGGLLAGLGAMAPVLGLTLGVSAGGQSRFGQVLGGAGGLLAGGVAAAFLAPGMFAATGLFGAMGPAIAGLLSNPFTAVAAGALIVGALILAKKKRRQEDEKKRNALSTQSLTDVYQILWAAQRGDLTLSQARGQWDQVHSQYTAGLAGIKDSKTLRNALLYWDYIEGTKVDPGGATKAIWPQIAEAAKAGEKAKLVKQGLIPEFAAGGLVPYFGGMQTLIKVRPTERIDDASGFSWVVPGIDRGVDSVLTAATPRSRVLTRAQQARIPGFADGMPGVFGELPPIELTLNVTSELVVSDEAAEKIVVKGAQSSDGRKVILRVQQKGKQDSSRN